MGHLKNKVALVTGGSRGIGAGIARRLASEGASVVITYKNNESAAVAVVNELEQWGNQCQALMVDAANAAAIKPAIEQIIATYGRLDILINNAGYMDASGTALADIPLETIEQTLKVNIQAAFLLCQYASRFLKQDGRIINIGSCLTERVPGSGLTLYSMSKSAITGLTKGLARDLGARGITVNQISPGPIDTDMNPSNGPSADFQRSLTATGSYGKPADIAAMVSFLVGEQAGFITGANIAIDGGTNI